MLAALMSTASLSCGESFDECRKSKQAVDTPPTPKRASMQSCPRGFQHCSKPRAGLRPALQTPPHGARKKKYLWTPASRSHFGSRLRRPPYNQLPSSSNPGGALFVFVILDFGILKTLNVFLFVSKFDFKSNISPSTFDQCLLFYLSLPWDESPGSFDKCWKSWEL